MQSAGDYQKFKELMRSKNEELHKQAMELLIEQGKAHPSPHSNSIEDNYEDSDLKEAIRYPLPASVQSIRYVNRPMIGSLIKVDH